MAGVSAERSEVHARILYWGPVGAGKSANLRTIHRRLRPDHRGQMREVPTRVDPTVTYEVLPIELGEIAGAPVQLQIMAAPGSAEHAPTRKQLLDGVDGLVLVVDGRSDRIDANLAAFGELRSALAAYGRALHEMPMVVQYNKRDVSDAYTLEELHRKLDVRGAPVFEAVATEGTGVLQTLTTISKRVIRHLREHASEERPAPGAAVPPAGSTPGPEAALEVEPDASVAPAAVERGILAEEQLPELAAEVAETTERAQALLEESWPEVTAELIEGESQDAPRGLSIESVGRASRAGDAVRVPLVLSDGAGRRLSVALTVRLDLLPDAEDET